MASKTCKYVYSQDGNHYTCNVQSSCQIYLSWLASIFLIYVVTLALGSRPSQRGCKGAGQGEARESHQRLLGV